MPAQGRGSRSRSLPQALRAAAEKRRCRMNRKSEHVKTGVTAFLTVGAILLFYDTLFGHHWLLNVWRQLMTAVRPILYGAFMAYLLAPVVNFFEDRLFSAQVRKARERGRFTAPAVRAASLLRTWLLVCLMFYILASVLLPELYKSVLQLVSNVENYYNTIAGWVETLLATYPDMETLVVNQMNAYYQDISGWLSANNIADWLQKALSQAQTVMSLAAGSVMGLVNFLKNLLVGVIVSVYLLAAKEYCAAFARRAAYGLFSRKNAGWLLRGVHRVDVIFSGFVRGKLLDSLIIGILCFISCSILKFPYTPLVSVIVGLTNIIPFFGPFLGAVPSAFLILLVSPMKALYFLLFILVLQQLDGNVIGPKILGDTTGLSSLWVIIAILVGGSFFGLPGMFFGVPVCACLYSLFTFLVDTRLKKKQLPTEVSAYTGGVSGAASPDAVPAPPAASPAEPEEDTP